MYIYKAGVVGAGLMGSGIAQVITFGGLPVVLKDVSQELVDQGIAAARGVYAARVKKGKMTPEDLEKKMSLITGTTSLDDFKEVDIAKWNTYTVIARGNHLIHKVNGQITAEVIDNDKQDRSMSGILALQIHRGEPMIIRFRNIRLKELK